MMNAIFLIFRTVLFMSVSGSLFILILLLGKRFLKNTFSRQWQYYVWLIVVLRLLLPFGSEINLMGSVYQAFDRTIMQVLSTAGQENSRQDAADFAVDSENMAQEIQKADQPESTAGEKRLSEWQNRLSAGKEKPEGGISVVLNGIGWVWLFIALGMLIRKITAYQSFVRYVAAGAEPVSDVAFLEELSAAASQVGVDRRVELCVNPLLSSPTLTGVFRPCIVLSGADVSREEFRYIVIHELTHCKRWDIFYKWLVQVVVCLHWFNPLVHLMSREIDNACEFSCDEAVLKKTGYENARDYGKTLLETMAAVGKYRESSAAVTLSANKELLKERLRAIMSCGEKSGAVRVLTVVLTICLIFGAVFIGGRPVQADVAEASEAEEAMADTQEISSAKVPEEKGSLGGEEISEQIGEFYQSASFQSVLFDRLDMDEEKDKREEELGKKQMEEYRAVGVTKEGKNYYYQGQLVNIFLDMRPNYSFYTLDINPAGTVNIKILRGEDGQITGVAYLTEEEFRELFGDMGEELTEEYPRTMYVNVQVCKVREGAGEEFTVVGLIAEEEEVTVLEMVEGSGGRNWYRVDKESLPEDMEVSAEECYIRSDLLRKK